MRAFTTVFSVKLLAVFSLFLVFGCAQNSYAVKENDAGIGEVATLKDITVTGEGNTSRIEILADKPLTYTYYSLKEPFRTVIDLSQTDPGTVKAPVLDGSLIIKKVHIEKNELSSGSLVRITIETDEEVSVASVPDSLDNSKLLFNVIAPQKIVSSQGFEAVSQPDEDLIVDNTITPAEKQATTGTSPDAVNSSAVTKPLVEPAASVNTPTYSQPKSPVPPLSSNDGNVASRHAPLSITRLDVVTDGVVIQADGPLTNYKYFTLTTPPRLAIDILKAKSALSSKTITLNSNGIASARIGTYPDKVRIVFDSPQMAFPSYKLVKVESGLKLVLSSPGDNSLHAAYQEKSDSVVSSAPIITGNPGNSSTVEAIDFKIVDGYSRISVTTSGDCVLSGPAKTADGLVITFARCSLPKRLQRPFDTSAFASVVKKLTPYQTRVKGRQDVKILIALREDTPFTLKRDGEVVNLDIKNPEIPASPQLISGNEGYPVAAVTHQPTTVKQNSVPEKGKALNAVVEKKLEKKVYTGRRVTLEFVDADIRKIFQLIAEVSNYNILVGDDVTGTISIKLVNVPWDQALDVILDTKGLGMKRKDNIIVIRPLGKITSLADEELAAQKAYEKTLELRTRVFDVNYASVSDIAAQFNTYKSERGTISVDARTNRVIVNDISPRLERMADLLKHLDIPEKQVLIEARIVEATSSFTQDLGIQWGIHYRDGSASLLGINSLDSSFGGIITNIPPTSGFQPATSAGGSLGLSFGKLTSNVQIDLRLSAAAETGEVKIISTPKVVTLNNKAAKISQGQMIPYSTVSAEGTKTEFIEAALTLEVTPHITASGAVSMKIKASNNSAGSAPTGVAPPINKKEATTELLVQNGETTVIGGIYVDSDSTTDSGVPYLKDIPLLGWLFKSQNQQKTKTELLIFITPKIVT